MKKTIAMLLTAALSASLLSGCVSTAQNTTAAQSAETYVQAGTEGKIAQDTPADGSSAAQDSVDPSTGSTVFC